VGTSIRDRLLADRRALLDLGTRNRLINIPLRTKGIRAVEVVDGKSAEVFDLLGQAKRFVFVPAEEEKPDSAQPEDGSTTEIRAPAPKEENWAHRARQAETRLQTKLSSEGLQKRLLDIWYDARTLEEEQGVNILYLAFGLLNGSKTKSLIRSALRRSSCYPCGSSVVVLQIAFISHPGPSRRRRTSLSKPRWTGSSV
jgi:hypothetical protein